MLFEHRAIVTTSIRADSLEHATEIMKRRFKHLEPTYTVGDAPIIEVDICTTYLQEMEVKDPC